MSDTNYPELINKHPGVWEFEYAGTRYEIRAFEGTMTLHCWISFKGVWEEVACTTLTGDIPAEMVAERLLVRKVDQRRQILSTKRRAARKSRQARYRDMSDALFLNEFRAHTNCRENPSAFDADSFQERHEDLMNELHTRALKEHFWREDRKAQESRKRARYADDARKAQAAHRIAQALAEDVLDSGELKSAVRDLLTTLINRADNVEIRRYFGGKADVTFTFALPKGT